MAISSELRQLVWSRAAGSLRLSRMNDQSLYQLIIFPVGSYPHPYQVGAILHGKRAVVETDSR